MGMRLTAWGAGILAAALIFAGCGGSDDSSSTNSISKEQFITKADAICKKGTKRLQAAIFAALKDPRNLTKVSNAEQIKIVKTAMVPNVSREVKELRALGIPDGDEEKVDAMITALEEGVEIAEQDPQVVTKSSDAVFGISSRIATEYGLEACGRR
jgi:hypothetical protein